MTNRVIIVTGAASGIGQAIAEHFATEGWRVTLVDKDAVRGRAVAEAIGGLFVEADLAQRQACRHVVDATLEHYGGVDALVNNAGFQHIAPIEEFDEDAWDALLAVMLTAPFVDEVCLAHDESARLGPRRQYWLSPQLASIAV